MRAAFRQLRKQGVGDVEMEEIKAREELVIAQDAMHAMPSNTNVISRERQARERYTQARKNAWALLQQKAKINRLKC